MRALRSAGVKSIAQGNVFATLHTLVSLRNRDRRLIAENPGELILWCVPWYMRYPLGDQTNKRYRAEETDPSPVGAFDASYATSVAINPSNILSDSGRMA